MEQAALERQKRLAALRQVKAQESTKPIETSPENNATEEPTETEGQATTDFTRTLEEEAKELLTNALAATPLNGEDLNLGELAAGKKANADLKREMETRMAVLEERTQAAINQLIRQRLAAAKESTEETS